MAEADMAAAFTGGLPAEAFEGAGELGAGDKREATHAGSGSLWRTTPVSSGRPSSRRPSPYCSSASRALSVAVVERGALGVEAGEIGGVHVVAAFFLGLEDERDLAHVGHVLRIGQRFR